MCPWYSLVLLAACVLSGGGARQGFEAEELVPVRLPGRTGRRVTKRSEDHPRFRVTAFGRNFTLNLQPDTRFIAPSMTVYHLRAKDFSTGEAQGAGRQVSVSAPRAGDTGETAPAGSELRGCFFTGTVDFKEESVVSLSLCHGIVGAFISDGDEYQIMPKHFGTRTRESSTDQPHVITRHPLPTGRWIARTDGESSPRWGKHRRVSSGSSRRRRFVSVPRFIETLVVADASVSSFYGEDTKASGQTHEHIGRNHFRDQFIKQFTPGLGYYMPGAELHLRSGDKRVIRGLGDVGRNVSVQ